ncbi:MAG: RNA polymerase sigma factor [Rhodobacter sp.]|jgi:RNA polymerase sigma-70 factor (ECF subfamily)|nr:RNA polymerase sigma factor [Rhodobacter sp.]
MTMPFDAMTAVSDDDLLALYAKGDRLAARVLTERLVPRVLGYASRILGGDRAEAEDVAQEAMLRLWRIAPDWRAGEAKVSTWLYRVVTNLCTDRLRSGSRRARPMGDDLPDAADEAPGAETRMLDDARLTALNAALGQLPDRQREAVVLRHIEGLSNPEIAEVLGVGVEAVESLTARGKRALSAALGGQRAALGYEES